MVSRVTQSYIVSGYGLGDRGSIPGRGKAFSFNLCVQTGSGAHPASCTVGNVGPFPGTKARSERDTDHSHVVPRSRMCSSYTSSPLSVFMACSGTAFKDTTEGVFTTSKRGISRCAKEVSLLDQQAVLIETKLVLLIEIGLN
jgi:hypothetical protein